MRDGITRNALILTFILTLANLAATATAVHTLRETQALVQRLAPVIASQAH